MLKFFGIIVQNLTTVLLNHTKFDSQVSPIYNIKWFLRLNPDYHFPVVFIATKVLLEWSLWMETIYKIG